MSEKSDKREFEKRILEVSRRMLSGWSNKKIIQYSAETWGIEERQTRKYISSAYSMWHKEYKKRLKAGLDYHMAMRMKLYEEAYKGKTIKVTKVVKGNMVTTEKTEDQDFRLCLEIAKDIAKLEGLYVEKHDVNLKGELKITDARQKFVDRINRIVARTREDKTT